MTVQILEGDCREKLRELPAESVHCVVTSPPYWGLRDYGVDGMIGLEQSFDAFLSTMVDVFREVRRVLRKDGVLWLNMGDAYCSMGGAGGSMSASGLSSTKAAMPRPEASDPSKHGRWNRDYSGLKPKDLMMQPARLALALQADGWYLRSMMPWLKRSAMPESVTDRPATAIEYVFLLTKSPRYFFDMEAVRQVSEGGDRSATGRKNYRGLNGRESAGGAESYDAASGHNFRNSDLFYTSLEPPFGLISAEEPLALDVNPKGFAESHFATFPPKLIEPLIKAGTSEKGVCAECGAPWVREVEAKTYGDWRNPDRSTDLGEGNKKHRDKFEEWSPPKTLGWSPSCSHNAPVKPATVLDPFGGAGTTGLVADQLGRHAILIELNPDYADMAHRRIQDDAGMFADLV